jgi:lysylphosphatidylglycerol synthetase-like protein (DUF2156 family)
MKRLLFFIIFIILGLSLSLTASYSIALSVMLYCIILLKPSPSDPFVLKNSNGTIRPPVSVLVGCIVCTAAKKM